RQRSPLIAAEIEGFGLERAVAARVGRLGALPVLIIVGDRLEAGVGRAGVACVADDQIVVGEMVEQGGEPLLEEGKPMVDAGEAAAFGDGLVDGIAGGVGAEPLAVAGAEALDAVL